MTVDGFALKMHTKAMFIYKIFRSNEWYNFKASGETAGAPIDLADRYIHFSTSSQVKETAEKYFSGSKNLYLAAIDTAKLGKDLKWEISRGGEEFPHLYNTLKMTDVAWHLPLPIVDGRHKFPDKFE